MTMTITRIFDAPIEQVWNAWREPQQVMKWWGPTRFTASVARMDFRESGSSLIGMRPPQGPVMYNLWVYQKIEPLKRIEFTQYWSDKEGTRVSPADIGFPADLPREVPHVLTFKALSADKAELTITESGYVSAQHVELSKAGMAECLAKLAATLLANR